LSFPNSDRTELGNPVFNIIERYFVNVQLSLPGVAAIRLKTRPIGYRFTKFGEYLLPGVPSFFSIMGWVFIHPMLEFIDRRYPWQGFQDGFGVLSLCLRQFIFMIKNL